MNKLKNKRINLLIGAVVLALACFFFTNCNEDAKDSFRQFDTEAVANLIPADYKNIEIKKEFTDITDSDIENIVSWDLTSSDSYISVDREYIKADDIVLLEAVYGNDTETETVRLYYEIGENDIFKSDEVFIDKKVGTSMYTDMIISEEYVSANVKVIGIFRYPTMLDEEFILSYYNCTSMDEVETFIRERAYNEIVFNYMWEYILKNSTVKEYPEYVQEEINLVEDKYKAEADKANISFDEYISKEDVNYESEIENIYLYYNELLIAQKILEKENIKIDDNTIQDIITLKCGKMEIDSSEIYMYYSYNDLYYEAVMKCLRDVLIPLIQII